MAAPPEAEKSLESLINKATNPQNKDTDWGHIKAFYEQLNNEAEGPNLATRLLAHKIQSPQEWEAMQALMVLETCMKNCGKRFHLEVGKFRFLNELIKVVSPKYLGSRAPEPVKNKVLEMMYSWSVGLPEETKIADAYLMLKKQGIVQQDPVLPDDRPLPPPPPRTNVLFEDEEKSKTLSRLLTSADADDLKAANKLIKEMVQEDQQRTEKVSKRLNTIQEVKESVGLLNQLLGAYSAPGGHSREHISHSNQELIKDLYQRCEKMRPTLFRLASDTEDNDEALADILQANDHLTQVINLYRHLVKGEDVNGDAVATPPIPGSSGTSLLDLTGLDTDTPTAAASSNQGKASIRNPSKDTTGLNLLDDELMSLGLSEATQSSNSQLGDWNTFQSSDSVDVSALLPTLLIKPHQAPSAGGAAAPPKTLDQLDVLGKTLLQQSLPPQHQHVKWDKLQPPSRLSLRDLQTQSNAPRTSSRALGSRPGLPPDEDSLSDLRISLADVTVPLESIKPSRMLPVTVVDKLSLRVLFHWASCPPARPDVLVVIISMLSSAPCPLTNIRFQAAVPKVMRVKLQPPSGSDLPAFNPVLPPTAITQILLLANPHKDKVRLRYKLTFNLGNEAHDESGDVEQFPPPDTWGTL